MSERTEDENAGQRKRGKERPHEALLRPLPPLNPTSQPSSQPWIETSDCSLSLCCASVDHKKNSSEVFRSCCACHKDKGSVQLRAVNWPPSIQRTAAMERNCGPTGTRNRPSQLDLQYVRERENEPATFSVETGVLNQVTRYKKN